MATINLNNVKHLPQGVLEAPYGNVTSKQYYMETDSSGILTNPGSDQATAVIIGDIVRLGIIKGGSKLVDGWQNVLDASTASVTGKLGFEYVDGEDDADVPEDDDYFLAATTLAATGITRKTAATKIVTIPKDAYLIMTIAGAAHASVFKAEISVITEQMGA